MLRLYNGFPECKNGKIYIAVSGGVDSMVLADFIVRGGRTPTILHVNHGTSYANTAEAFVESWAKERNLPYEIFRIQDEIPKGQSKEHFWRDQRYAFFFTKHDGTILLGHHLNDAIEHWIFSCVHGTPSLMRYKYINAVRPLLLTSRKEIEEYAKSKNVPFVEDPSNADTSFMRNHIRHDLMPGIKKVNPGIEKMIFKKLKDRADKEKLGLN